jgi:hypothetical protein
VLLFFAPGQRYSESAPQRRSDGPGTVSKADIDGATFAFSGNEISGTTTIYRLNTFSE